MCILAVIETMNNPLHKFALRYTLIFSFYIIVLTFVQFFVIIVFMEKALFYNPFPGKVFSLVSGLLVPKWNSYC